MIKVIVVDDDADLLEMVGMMLNTPGIEALCLEDCKEVLPTLEEDIPHVLVMDIFLGDCDGRQLCKEVKRSAKYSSLPVLLYSAGQITQASIVDSGADAFLSKPFNMHVLLTRIHELAKRGNAN